MINKCYKSEEKRNLINVGKVEKMNSLESNQVEDKKSRSRTFLSVYWV